jgi:hypothetical protein
MNIQPLYEEFSISKYVNAAHRDANLLTVIASLRQQIAEQLHTIKSLNNCIGGAESLTLDNIKSAGEWLKEDENLLGRISRERDEVVSMLGMLATERNKVEVLTKQLAEQPNVDVLVEALDGILDYFKNMENGFNESLFNQSRKALATYQSKNEKG